MEIDWRHEARTLIAAGYGQREAARKLGVPEDRLRKWASRAGVKSSVTTTVANHTGIVTKVSPPALKHVTNVTTAAEIMQDDAERLGPEARHIAARIAHKSLLHVEYTVDADPERGLVQLDSALTAGKLLRTANAKGWENQPSTQENHSHLHLHQHLKPDALP